MSKSVSAMALQDSAVGRYPCSCSFGIGGEACASNVTFLFVMVESCNGSDDTFSWNVGSFDAFVWTCEGRRREKKVFILEVVVCDFAKLLVVS